MTTQILRAYKTELDPTAEQRRMLQQHVAGARIAHNWVLEQWRVWDAARAVALGARALAGHDARGGEAACCLGYTLAALHRGRLVRARTKAGEPQRYRYAPVPGIQIADFRASTIDWYSQLVHTRDEQPERFGWLADISSFTVREAVLDVSDGWKHFFEHLKAGRFDKAGEPRFRRWSKATYHADQPDPIRVTDRTIKVPGIGWIRLKERGYLPVTEEKSHRFVRGGKAIGIGVSERDGRWHVALRCSVPQPTAQARGPGKALRDRPVPRMPGHVSGVEVGVSALAVTSDGLRVPGLRDDDRIAALVRLRQLWERRMARRWVDGRKTRDQSAGWREAVARVRHYHDRITMLRDDMTGKAARQIVDSGAAVIVMREPAIAGQLGRRGKTGDGARTRNALAPSVHAARQGELRRRIAYKQAWAGGEYREVPASEPVTDRCSRCSAVRATDAAYPDFACESCGHRENRDDNAASNIRDYRAPSGDPAAEPQSAAPKPPQGDNGREKRMARVRAKAPATVPHGDETSALGSGNRACPGALHSVQPIASHHDNAHERLGDAQLGSGQFRQDTATVRADDLDRSQTVSQVSEIALAHRDDHGAMP